MPTPEEFARMTPESFRAYEAKQWFSAVVDCGLAPASLDREYLTGIIPLYNEWAEYFGEVFKDRERDAGDTAR
jgi:hypothetical protein